MCVYECDVLLFHIKQDN